MGFSEGTEDEFLLNCFVCKEPFGMLAAFCGGCGVRRDQAMGIERAKPSQQITQNKIETPSLIETFPLGLREEIEDSNQLGSPTAVNSNSSPLMSATGVGPLNPLKRRKKSIRRQMFVSNMRLRIDVINEWQIHHSRLLNSLGSLLFICATYLFVQSFIVGTSHPEVAAENYIKAAVTRDSSYFEINKLIKDSENYPIFPVKFTKGIEASDWFHSSDIKGLSGTAEVSVIPSGSQFDQTPIVLKMTASFVKKWGIFREPKWMPALQTATVDIAYPSTSNTVIYINGYMAGTTDNPEVKEGKYFVFPGRLEVKFYRNGEETDDSFEYFIQPSGKY